MKNARTTFIFIIALFLADSILLAQTPWTFGIHSIMGLSGSIRQDAATPVFDGQLGDFSGKEQLQLSYGVGLWLERSLNRNWSINVTTSFQRVGVLANSRLIVDTPDLYYFSRNQSSWESQYFQLSFNSRYYFGEAQASNRWFIGAGVQGIYVYRHDYLRVNGFRYDPMLGPSSGFSSEGVVFTEKITPRSAVDLERSPLGVAGRLEVGLRINRWSLSVVNTTFFQKRREGVPGYDRYLGFSDPNPDGSITAYGIPLRYVRSATLHFAYQIK